ncbi:MAG: DUF2442 domain-containing protein [Gemmatimonadales bacterium]
MELSPRVVAVEPLPDMELRLRFADGSEGLVRLAERLRPLRGMTLPLGDPDFFRQVTIDHEAGTVTWPNGVDLDPDVLYALAHGRNLTDR